MNPSLTLSAATLLCVAMTSAGAQSRTIEPERPAPPGARVFSITTDRNQPRIGVSVAGSGRRDTLGLLVAGVIAEGPAAKAGIEEGDRLQSINGVNLRLSALDAGEADMDGVALRRLTRELGKTKVGDEVELRVHRDGQARSVRLRTVSAESLTPEPARVLQRKREQVDRATLGIGLGLSASRRDTAGILIATVVDDGPADKARIEEGDRIASVNGVDVRVPREDAGDWAMANSRARRLTRELDKVRPGDAVELRLHRAGQVRTVRVTAVAQKDMPHSAGFSFFMGGELPFMTNGLMRMEGLPSFQDFQREGGWGQQFHFSVPDDGDVRLRIAPKIRTEMELRADSLAGTLRDAIARLRTRIHTINRPAPQPSSRGKAAALVGS